MRLPSRPFVFLLALAASGCNRSSATPGDRYARAIDDHVDAYVGFTVPDRQMRERILADYRRAIAFRNEYHRTGTIAQDPLVRVITPGNNLFLMDSSHVGVFLSPTASLECSGVNIWKPDGVPAQIIVIGGNRGFWQVRDADAKFISTTLTLPANENTLTIQSNSWSPGKIIVVGKVLGAAAVVLGLTGCTPKTEQPPPPATNPEGGCAQPSPPVTIAAKTLFATATFKASQSQDAQDFLTGAGKTQAEAALAAKQTALAAGKCIDPCVATWNPEPAISGYSKQALVGVGGGGGIGVFLESSVATTLVCSLP